MPADPADHGAGSLVAQALGDALGFLVEGQHPVLCAHFAGEAFSCADPPSRLRGPFAFGQYSDDTQLARELGLSLTLRAGWAPDDFGARLAALFRDETIVGRGRATQSAAERLLRGVAWDEAGEPSPSAGNGAAMRVAPVGLCFTDDAERLRVADEQARITHRDPRSRAAAVLVADVVAYALRGEASADDAWLGRLAMRVEPLDPALACGVRDMTRWLALDEDAAFAQIARAGEAPRGVAHRFEQWHGISPFATPSALYALYAFLRSPADAEAVLRRSVAVGGDVDTVAAMAGAMVGASVGLSGLSPRLRSWAERLNDQGAFGLEELTALGRTLTGGGTGM